jgi:hypothetical protein
MFYSKISLLKKISRREKHLFIYSDYKIILPTKKKIETTISSLLRGKYCESLIYKSAYLIKKISRNYVDINPKKSHFAEIISVLKNPRKMRKTTTSLEKFVIFFNIEEFYTIRRYGLYRIYDFYNWPVRIIGYTKLDKKSFLRYSLGK